MMSIRGNVVLLATCQALMMSGMSLIITTAALVGFNLAADKSLSTLPLAVVFIAMMFTSIPASMLMQRIGRKAGFLLAALFSISGAILATIAIMNENYWLFVFAMACIGIFNAFGNYLRFAVVEIVEESFKSKAVSLVMAGGVVAAIVGPNLANWLRHSIDNAVFAGSYAALIGVYGLLFIVLLLINIPAKKENESGAVLPARSLWVIVTQPRFITALVCGMFGYGVMNLIMTATPLAMHHHAHSFSDTAFVIQWHALGMFAPSFVTGHLIKRFGVLTILFIGGVLGLACVLVNLNGSTVSHYWMALVLLGISWNFLFIGATVLLTETYRPAESAKAQAVNEFAVFTTVAFASLSSGVLQNKFGWQAVNYGVLPFLLLILLSIMWVGLSSRKDARTSSVSVEL